MSRRCRIVALLTVALLFGGFATRSATAGSAQSGAAFIAGLNSFNVYLLQNGRIALYNSAITAGSSAAQAAGTDPVLVKLYDGEMGTYYNARQTSTDTNFNSRFDALDAKYATYRADLLAEQAATNAAVKKQRDLQNYLAVKNQFYGQGFRSPIGNRFYITWNQAFGAAYTVSRNITSVAHNDKFIQQLYAQINTLPASPGKTTLLSQLDTLKTAYNLYRVDMVGSSLP